MQIQRTAQGASKSDAMDAAAATAPKANTPDATLAALKTKLVGLSAQYSDEYPEVIETNRRSLSWRSKSLLHPPRGTDSTGTRLCGWIGPAADCRLQHRIADTPAHEEAIAAVNRDFGILSSRYHDLSDLLFQARADQAYWNAGRATPEGPAAGRLPLNPSYPNRAALIGGGVALTLFVALAIPLLCSTRILRSKTPMTSKRVCDVSAFAISRVPEVERRLLESESISVSAPLALPPMVTPRARLGWTHRKRSCCDRRHFGRSQRREWKFGAAYRARRKVCPALSGAALVEPEKIWSARRQTSSSCSLQAQSWAVQRNAKIFVIASAVGGEGKSLSR